MQFNKNSASKKLEEIHEEFWETFTFREDTPFYYRDFRFDFAGIGKDFAEFRISTIVHSKEGPKKVFKTSGLPLERINKKIYTDVLRGLSRRLLPKGARPITCFLIEKSKLSGRKLLPASSFFPRQFWISKCPECGGWPWHLISAPIPGFSVCCSECDTEFEICDSSEPPESSTGKITIQ